MGRFNQYIAFRGWTTVTIWRVFLTVTQNLLSCRCLSFYFIYIVQWRMWTPEFSRLQVFSFLKKFIYLFGYQVLAEARGILVTWPGIEPGPPMWGAQSLNQWTNREVPAGYTTLDKWLNLAQTQCHFLQNRDNDIIITEAEWKGIKSIYSGASQSLWFWPQTFCSLTEGPVQVAFISVWLSFPVSKAELIIISIQLISFLFFCFFFFKNKWFTTWEISSAWHVVSTQ